MGIFKRREPSVAKSIDRLTADLTSSTGPLGDMTGETDEAKLFVVLVAVAERYIEAIQNEEPATPISLGTSLGMDSIAIAVTGLEENLRINAGDPAYSAAVTA